MNELEYEVAIRHGKRITIETIYDGEVQTTAIDYQVDCFTDRNTMLKDVIDALAVLTNGSTTQLHLDISIDKKGRFKLSKEWRV